MDLRGFLEVEVGEPGERVAMTVVTDQVTVCSGG
jgi:hypothetical protein